MSKSCRASILHPPVLLLAAFAGIFIATPVRAVQVDIAGPAGSAAFGTGVTALPNGNFVVTDPQFAVGPATNAGAVHLYGPAGTLISTLTGSSTDDQISSGGVRIVGSSNFLVLSPHWKNGAATGAGAATWVDGSSGLSAAVSAANSLVGTTLDDFVGADAVILTNGNYVVCSPNWNSGVVGAGVGAATWGAGNGGIAGLVSAANSLVGSSVGDRIADGDAQGIRVRALSNGNYVVISPGWNNSVPSSRFGAVTWGNGSSGIAGVVSAGNSLVGTTLGDAVGGRSVTALSNGNYVVASPTWNNGVEGASVGAATWGNGSSGTVGPVSAGNSLIGTTGAGLTSDGDNVGSDVAALSNGNYVVISFKWNNGVPGAAVGAATWGNGSSGITGAVSTANSLYGTTAGDSVGVIAVALANGNYVVGSNFWNNGLGAATCGDGASGTVGAVSSGNSLVGTTAGDHVGEAVIALSNGNYVVTSPQWNNGVPGSFFGAATWGDGGCGVTGPVTTSNSLYGTTALDEVGYAQNGTGVLALGNGNYVVLANQWNNGVADSSVGAATWGNGSSGISGAVSTGNSLYGTAPQDVVGFSSVALSNGNYVLGSPGWNGNVGAATWGKGKGGVIGAVSAANSLIGSTAGDGVGYPAALGDGNYLVRTPLWNGSRGAVTLASGAVGLKGTIDSTNSVLGTAENGGSLMTFDYDSARHELFVGRPADNIVSLFRMDRIFVGDFEE